MKYIDIAHVNKRVSRIVCGTAAAPYNTGADCNELLSGIAVLAYSALARGLFSGKFSSGSERAARAALDKYALKGYLTQDNLARLARCEKLARMKGVTVAQIALAYVLCAQPLSMAAVSCSRIARMEENALAADMELSAEEISYLEGGIAAQ